MQYLCNSCHLTFHQGKSCPVCGKSLKEEELGVRFLEPDLMLEPEADKKEIAEKYQVSEESILTVYFPFWNISVAMDQDVVYTLETVKDGISNMKTALVHVKGGFFEQHYETVKYKSSLLSYLKKTSFEKAVGFDRLLEDEFMVLARDDKRQKGNCVHQMVTDLLTQLGEENEVLTGEGRPVCDTAAEYEIEERAVVLVPVYMIREKGRKCIVDAMTGELLSDNKPAKKAAYMEAAVFLALTVLYGVIQYFAGYQLVITFGYILLVFVSAMFISVPEDALENKKKEEEENDAEVEFAIVEIVNGQKELSWFMEKKIQ